MIGYYQPTACGILVTRDEIPSAAVVDLAEYHVALYDVSEMSRRRARIQSSEDVSNVAINIRRGGHAMPLINERGTRF